MKDNCDKCGKFGQIITRDKKTGVKMCHHCYSQDVSRHEPCFWCGKKRHVFLRTKYDAALCEICYNSIRRHLTYLHAKCAGCGEYKKVYSFTQNTGKPLCFRCRKKTHRATDCPHHDRPVYARGRCESCYRRWRQQEAKKKKTVNPVSYS